MPILCDHIAGQWWGVAPGGGYEQERQQAAPNHGTQTLGGDVVGGGGAVRGAKRTCDGRKEAR